MMTEDLTFPPTQPDLESIPRRTPYRGRVERRDGTTVEACAAAGRFWSSDQIEPLTADQITHALRAVLARCGRPRH